jgi:hypothetical protein
VNVLCQKRADDLGDFRTVFFQREMSGVQEMQFRVRQIFQKRFRAGWSEYWIVLAPDHEHGGLLVAQVFVPRRIQRGVVAIVVEQRELDLIVAWPV